MTEARVANASDVPPDRGLRVEVCGIEVGVFRVRGRFVAIENACPHAYAPLHTGTVDDCIVTCPAHGFRYDLLTGHSAEGADGFPIPRFRIEERDGILFIAVEDDGEGRLRPVPLPRVRPSPPEATKSGAS